MIELAKKYNFVIMEEEDDHEFWWGKYPFRPIAQYAYDGRVIYCAAMSRASRYLQHLRTVIAASSFIRGITSISNAGFSYRDIEKERVITALLESVNLPMLVRKLRISKRRDLMSLTDILQLQLGKYASFEMPLCGTAIWLSFTTKMDLLKVLDAVNTDDQQIRYIAYCNGSNQQIRHLQLNFSRSIYGNAAGSALKSGQSLKTKSCRPIRSMPSR